ncbi:hypothetical protein BDW59DRAFT_157363 [Aspergillus cavernicola]|uniref:Tautomerase cis-CaaD-like domain-containing protein n=1 Tax=Aspergillus cavernicola TaxID=176166 RepID=A0ABR4IY22_9EURO
MPATYVLTGILNTKRDLNEASSRQICNDFATFLRSKLYKNYKVWAGYRRSDDVWRFLVALPGPFEEMPELPVLNTVSDTFKKYVIRDTFGFGWVNEDSDEGCFDDVIPDWRDWNEMGDLEDMTTLSCDSDLGETY